MQQVQILKVSGTAAEKLDLLAVEEPLEIRLGWGPASDRQQKNISVTMRTPGHDFELVLGFLFTEGIIKNYEEVANIHYCQDQGKQQAPENVVRVELSYEVQPGLQRLQRNFYTTSSCGVCGKASIEAIEARCPLPAPNQFTIDPPVIHKAPDLLRQAQLIFKHTGGLHAAGLFNLRGELLLWREDVGRHNALDKLIGACLIANQLPLQNAFVLLSGRVSFELVQKGIMAGVSMMAAVGAPSSLAVSLARQYQMSLLGFVRDQKFNIYSGAHRILLEESAQEKQ